jgi:hypothetical protein
VTGVTPRETKTFRLVFFGLLALHLALVLSTRLYPFTDLPDHLAAATIARAAGDPASPLGAAYAVDAFLKPNTAHLFFCSLPIFPSAELANRIWIALCVMLVPLSTLFAIRRLGGNPWYALLSFLLVYNYNMSWGFVGFALAVPLTILFASVFVLDERGPRGGLRILAAAAALVLLYFVHLLAALFCVLALLLAAAMRRRGALRSVAAAAAACAPLVILAAVWWRGETRAYAGTGLVPFLSHYYREGFEARFLWRMSVLIFDNYHLFAGKAGFEAAALFSLAIVAMVLYSVVRGIDAPPDTSRPSVSAKAVRPLVIAALLCVLFLPNEIPQQSVLYERFSVILLLSIIVWAGAKAPTGVPRPGAAVVTAVAILHLLLWGNYIVAFNRENAGFDAAFLRPARSGMKLAGLVADYTYRGRPIYIHFPSYYIVWEKEPATATLVDFRFGPVRRRVSAIELPRYLEWAGKLGSYDGRYHDMDYLLMRGGVPGAAAGPPEGFAVERTAGRWTLCTRTPAAR